MKRLKIKNQNIWMIVLTMVLLGAGGEVIAQDGIGVGHGGADHHGGHQEHAGHDVDGGDEEGVGHEEDAGHEKDAHAGHSDEEPSVIHLSAESMDEFGIEVLAADEGTLGQVLSLSGEVVYNADRIAHLTPTVAGIVQKAKFSVGQRVESGDLMAVLNSRELAATRSEYLASEARLKLSRENFVAKGKLYQSRIALSEENLARDERMFESKLGTERQVHVSRQGLSEVRVTFDLEILEGQQKIKEAEIAVNQSKNALYALGYTRDQIGKVATLDDLEFNSYELVAPLSGMVTERHLTIGEVIEPANGNSLFVVADLSTVWVNLTVYQRDLARVKPGQPVVVKFGHGLADAQGRVAFVSPSIDEHTRTATGRVVLENPAGDWRPGMFVSGEVITSSSRGDVVVPRSALQEIGGKVVVFVQNGDEFEVRAIRLGRETEKTVEVLAGLKRGERVVVRNGFALKAEMNRGALEHAGHAH